MRFLLGVLVGYSMRGKKKLLITILATIVFIVYIILPAIMLCEVASPQSDSLRQFGSSPH